MASNEKGPGFLSASGSQKKEKKKSGRGRKKEDMERGEADRKGSLDAINLGVLRQSVECERAGNERQLRE